MTRYALILFRGRYDIYEYDSRKTNGQMIADELSNSDSAIAIDDFTTREEADAKAKHLESLHKTDTI